MPQLPPINSSGPPLTYDDWQHIAVSLTTSFKIETTYPGFVNIRVLLRLQVLWWICMWNLLLVLPAFLVALYLWRRKAHSGRSPSAAHLAASLSSEPHIAAHAFSIRHRESVINSQRCGCFYCLAIFPPDEIQEWTDDGETAMCPECGIDSVIGSDSGYPITPTFLAKMQSHWF